MSVLIPTPVGHNHTTEVFKRTQAEASFLCNASDAVAMRKMPKKRANWRYPVALALLIAAAAIGLTGCSKAEAVAITAADAKHAAAGAWACPGMHAEWLDEKTVQCLKEVK